jgi:hypothetical protein
MALGDVLFIRGLFLFVFPRDPSPVIGRPSGLFRIVPPAHSSIKRQKPCKKSGKQLKQFSCACLQIASKERANLGTIPRPTKPAQALLSTSHRPGAFREPRHKNPRPAVEIAKRAEGGRAKGVGSTGALTGSARHKTFAAFASSRQRLLALSGNRKLATIH